MINLRLQTDRYSPDRHTIGICTSVDGWQAELPLTFTAPTWSIDLPSPAYAAGFAFKFRFNGEWQSGPDLSVLAGPDQTLVFTDADAPVPPRYPDPVGPLAERGRLQQKYFPSTAPAGTPDIIVIGSGMGGGTLADQLADLGARVLLLEAGGLVFPTHAANLPRRQRMGRFDKHLWQLWPDFQARPYQSGGQFVGGQGFNLGGRSVFWGGFIPRMTSWELDFWPRRVKWDLEDTFYDKAESLMGRSTAPDTVYGQMVHRALRRVLPQYGHKDAPMAVRLRPEGSNWIAAGLFSTADLLMESALTPGPSGNDRLRVLLNHDVVRVVPGAASVVVTARDGLTGELKSFEAPYAVLAAGTIESARIARRSGLVDPDALVGRGITDHPVHFTHFSIPASSPFYEPYGNVKIISQPKESPNGERDPFNVLLELGADFNHGRYLDPDIIDEHLRRRDAMLCEVVFLCHQTLITTNHVTYPAEGRGAETIAMAPSALDPALLARIIEVRDSILQALGGQVLTGPDGQRSEGLGGLGAVAHEVGTLRMRVQDGTRVSDGSRPRTDGLVDEDGAWIGHERLHVCDLSIFPSSPAANPSLTLVALALRMAEHLTARLGTR